MTYSELRTFLKDQKIIILPFYDDIDMGHPGVRRYSESEGFSGVGVIAEGEFRESYINYRLPSQYTGKTGKIVDARDRIITRWNDGGKEEIVELLVALEGEKKS